MQVENYKTKDGKDSCNFKLNTLEQNEKFPFTLSFDKPIEKEGKWGKYHVYGCTSENRTGSFMAGAGLHKTIQEKGMGQYSQGEIMAEAILVNGKPSVNYHVTVLNNAGNIPATPQGSIVEGVKSEINGQSWGNAKHCTALLVAAGKVELGEFCKVASDIYYMEPMSIDDIAMKKEVVDPVVEGFKAEEEEEQIDITSIPF